MCPDITMCKGEDCYARETCYRYIAEANPYYQAYFLNAPLKDGECEYYWHRCKHIWNVGDSCSKNNSCTFPDCDEDGPLKPIYKLNDGNGATLCHHCRIIISTGKPSKKLFCKECQEKRDEFIKKIKP